MQSQHIVENRILRQLSSDELKSIEPWLSPVRRQPNAVLHEQGAAIEQVYFPLRSGEAIETGIVGANGSLLSVMSRCRRRVVMFCAYVRDPHP